VTEADKLKFPVKSDFEMKALKTAKVRASDIKSELLRGMSAEDMSLVTDVKVPHNPANPLVTADARLISETIVARRVNKVTSLHF